MCLCWRQVGTFTIRGGEEIWNSDVMTGAVSTETPMFKSSMTYLVFNPTWTVPRSIAVRSLIPAMRADPGYVTKNDYQLIGRDGVAAGRTMAAAMEEAEQAATDIPDRAAEVGAIRRWLEGEGAA